MKRTSDRTDGIDRSRGSCRSSESLGSSGTRDGVAGSGVEPGTGVIAAAAGLAGDALDAELREEFEHHLDCLRRDEMCCGAGEELAARRALERFGDPELHARACRRVARGGFPMKRALVIGWNVTLAAGILLSLGLGISANVLHARALANEARERSQRSSIYSAVLPGIWGKESGTVRVEGAVARPGVFATSTSNPMSVATLVELAGGATGKATGVAWVQRPGSGEIWMPLENAVIYREDFNTMPAPGAVLTVK